MFNSSGMDAPWQYGRYGVCVDDQDEYLFLMTHVPAQVDNLVVVAHWYDRRHDASGNTLDDIDLKVDILNSSGGNIGSLSSDSGSNNKERVRIPMNTIYQTSSIAITLKGYKVTADSEGCGTNSNRVWISWYYEDTARDDADGPGLEIYPR